MHESRDEYLSLQHNSAGGRGAREQEGYFHAEYLLTMGSRASVSEDALMTASYPDSHPSTPPTPHSVLKILNAPNPLTPHFLCSPRSLNPLLSKIKSPEPECSSSPRCRE